MVSKTKSKTNCNKHCTTVELPPMCICISNYGTTIYPMEESEKELESLDESERGEERFGLKLNIQKTKIMASVPINSWQIDGEIVTEFIREYSKITADRW